MRTALDGSVIGEIPCVGRGVAPARVSARLGLGVTLAAALLSLALAWALHDNASAPHAVERACRLGA